jgi:hypothetical protein
VASQQKLAIGLQSPYFEVRFCSLGNSAAVSIMPFSQHRTGAMVAFGSKESAMSDNKSERRELTAAELDLVAGGLELENTLISNYIVSSGYSSFSWSETQTGSHAMFDIRQNRTA